jgi:hypothetical protein
MGPDQPSPAGVEGGITVPLSQAVTISVRRALGRKSTRTLSSLELKPLTWSAVVEIARATRAGGEQKGTFVALTHMLGLDKAAVRQLLVSLSREDEAALLAAGDRLIAQADRTFSAEGQ